MTEYLYYLLLTVAWFAVGFGALCIFASAIVPSDQWAGKIRQEDTFLCGVALDIIFIPVLFTVLA